MQLKAGDRVRCVDAPYVSVLTQGKEYPVENVTGAYLWIRDDSGRRSNWLASRFKPVVRVKAPTVYTGKAFSQLVERAVEAFGSLSPEQQQAMQNEQRKSWVRGEIALSRMGLG